MRVLWLCGAAAIVVGAPATFLGSSGGGDGAGEARADEPGVPASCPADVTADGDVGTPDLVAVLDAWATEGPDPADVNGDGIVDQGDLVQVILSWGPCPQDDGGIAGGGIHVCALEDDSFITADGGCKDLATGLVWSRSNLGEAGVWTWQGATNLASSSAEGGYDDWRLPTRDELAAVLANGAETHFGGGIHAGWQWSDHNNGPNWAWAVQFWDGAEQKMYLGGSIGTAIDFVAVRGGDGGGDPPPPPGDCNNDGVCDPGETCETCDDCEGKTNGPPSGRFCCGNGEAEGPEGNGDICDGNY